MSVRGIFEILEIEPTEDTKEIKKAYAKLVKKYHPEEHPEKWKEIHDAYEAAIAWAERREPDFPAFFVTDNVEKGDYATQSTRVEKKEELKLTKENIPKPVIKSEKTEIQLNRQEESGELDSLFDNIGALSRERQEQEQGVYEKELQEVLRSFGKISDKKNLDRKKWENFFSKKERLPYICNREFLKMLGECLSDRKIDAGMYHFLMDQLEVIQTYCADRNILLQTISGLDPVKYAEIKISGAYSRGRTAGSRNRHETTGSKTKIAVWVILIIIGTIIRSGIRNARHSEEVPEIYTIPDEVIERTMGNTVENAIADNIVENDSDNIVESIIDNTVEDDSNVTRIHISMVPDKIQIGDSKEAMIEALGNPGEIRKSQENTEYEEAVYSLVNFGDRLVVVLEDEIITEIYTEFELK